MICGEASKYLNRRYTLVVRIRVMAFTTSDDDNQGFKVLLVNNRLLFLKK